MRFGNYMSESSDTDNLDVDNEIGAIKTILAALAPLSSSVRNGVLEYVLKRLGINAPTLGASAAGAPTAAGSPIPSGAPPAREPDAAGVAHSAGPTAGVHIRDFKAQKQPRSAIEMAAVVAYFLAHLAAKPKTTVNAKDIEDQFRIAEYPLPAQAKFTLVNARNAGYLDAAGGGEYELNAVGHNLVAHSLPRGEQATSKPRKRKQAKRKA
jgi:hypothetical protein